MVQVVEKDELFRTGDKEKIWQSYCGFLDLSLEEFMGIQELLLLEEIELVAKSLLGKKIMGGRTPRSLTEFRHTVPLTTYNDYAPYLKDRNDDVLAEKPYCWIRTSGKSGSIKWVPYTVRAFQRLAKTMIAAFILASARRKGEVNVKEGEKVVLNLPPRPYLTGYIAHAAIKRVPYQAIPPLEGAEEMDFHTRIRKAFMMSLRSSVDLVGSISSVLVKIGEGFAEQSDTVRLWPTMLHPAVVFRLTRGLLCSKLKKRPMLPRDLWSVKGIVCGGTDTVIYKDLISYYWGVTPLDVYMCTEGSYIAMQSWTKKTMSFVPYCNFFEFIPESEWLKAREDKDYQPSTVLLDQVEEGQRYEVVLTNFYGMPFLRYRVGDLIKIVALKDEESGISLPQMVFESRIDDLIDIAGFSRLDEKTIWQAIVDSGVRYEDWTCRKEYSEHGPILHLYIELKESRSTQELQDLLNDGLMAMDSHYRDLNTMLEIKPLKVKLLSQGTFKHYYQEKQAAGFELAHLKPPHINAASSVIENLLRLDRANKVRREKA